VDHGRDVVQASVVTAFQRALAEELRATAAGLGDRGRGED
jgi:hypothetical protein